MGILANEKFIEGLISGFICLDHYHWNMHREGFRVIDIIVNSERIPIHHDCSLVSVQSSSRSTSSTLLVLLRVVEVLCTNDRTVPDMQPKAKII